MPRLSRALLLWLLPVAGCAFPIGKPGPQPSAEAVAACRKRANHEFVTQNHGILYQEDRYQAVTRDSPYSATGLPFPNYSRLSTEHEYDQDLDNCLNGGEGVGIVGDTPPPPTKGDAAPIP